MKLVAPSLNARRQRGVIMVVALVALVVLLIGAAAMIRSMTSSLSAAGSYGFKRDMSNQGMRALALVRTQMSTGALAADAARQSNAPALNYSAVMLPNSPEGIPTVLLASDADFATAGATANDITVADMQIQVRYVVDRLCTAVGVPSSSTCMQATAASPKGGTPQNGGAGAKPPPPQPVYRLTVRVTGPRNAQSFFQSTFTS